MLRRSAPHLLLVFEWSDNLLHPREFGFFLEESHEPSDLAHPLGRRELRYDVGIVLRRKIVDGR